MKVLIAGGAGFIGSTVASACLDDGITPVIIDNLSTGRPEFVRGRIFYPGDITDPVIVDKAFAEHPDIAAVVHCAALIVVPESVTQPLRYYRENVAKTLDFLENVLRNGCDRFIFSSSAAIYRAGEDLTVDESSPVEPPNPYAHTKAMVEQVLRDCTAAYPLRALSLRYFNPIGADPTMRTGQQSTRPTHALGRMIAAAADGDEFPITGTDFATRDGSGIRDYVHVWDLALAHRQALRRFDEILPPGGGGYDAVNIGTGTGSTVRELLRDFQTVLGRPVPSREAPRRDGDSAGSYTRTDRARDVLDWGPTLTVQDAIAHSLQWSRRRSIVLQ